MKFAYTFKTALRGIEAHKSRSTLTVLGIVIGVTAIIMVVAIGEGAQDLILAQVQSLGTKTIVVIPGREPSGPSDLAQIFSDSLKERDLELLKRKENVPNLARIMPVVFGAETAVYKNETYRVTLLGGTELAAELFDLRPSEGGFFFNEDVRGYADSAVIGAKVKKELFGESDAVGERIKIKGRNFRVAGVLPQKGQVSFFNFDEIVLAPYTTLQRYVFGIKHYHRFIVEADSEEAVPATVRDIELTLRSSHGISAAGKDDFFVETQADVANRLASIASILTVFLASIAAISLVVGGVGIMNIMLVSVTERTREIGLRKAIGARSRDILMQFLLEAVILTGAGGIIGIALGAILSLAVSAGLSYYLSLGWKFSFPVSAALLGILVSGAIGLIFGIYPARQASRKSPVEALRYE